MLAGVTAVGTGTVSPISCSTGVLPGVTAVGTGAVSSIGCSVGVLPGESAAVAGTMAGGAADNTVDDAGVALGAADALAFATVPTKPVSTRAWYIFIASF